MNAKEIKPPKAYIYTIEGVLDEEGVEKRFSIASLGRDINEEFDADCLAHSAALSFFIDYEDYRTEDKWPLKFRFLTKDKPVELVVELSFSPCFLTKPKSIVKVIEAKEVSLEDIEVLEEASPKKTRKPRAKAKVVSTELLDTLSSYEGYLTLVEKPSPKLKVFYGASLSNLDQLEQLLTSIKAVTGEFEEYFKIKFDEEYYVLQISEDFYEALTADEVFDPTIAEEGELIEAWHYV